MKQSTFSAEGKLYVAIFCDKSDLLELLRTERDLLEIASFVATVMLWE